jgi:hypothetical protein
MKIERFLKWIQDKLLNYPDISFITAKIFIDKFYDCLSDKEKVRYKLQLQTIKEFSLKQISIDSFVKEIVIENLTDELNNIKDDNHEVQTKEG